MVFKFILHLIIVLGTVSVSVNVRQRAIETVERHIGSDLVGRSKVNKNGISGGGGDRVSQMRSWVESRQLEDHEGKS